MELDQAVIVLMPGYSGRRGRSDRSSQANHVDHRLAVCGARPEIATGIDGEVSANAEKVLSWLKPNAGMPAPTLEQLLVSVEGAG